jgi:hypothetical protein
MNARYEPTAQKSFNLEEAATIMLAMDSFLAIINNEVLDGEKLHTSSLVLCNRYVFEV